MRSFSRIGALAPAVFAVVLAALVAPAAGWAQTRSAFIGTVSDSTGGVLPGASVTIESPDAVGGTQTMVTDNRGQYRFADLPPGTYTLTANLAGFQTLQRKGLRLPFSTTLTVDIPLGVGSAETVTVEGETPVIDVTTAQSTAQVDKNLISNLPLFSNQRDLAGVFELSPGSKDSAAFGSTANSIQVDGIQATLPETGGTNSTVVALTWLEEVKVVAVGATAEYGEFGGANANLVVRGGANDFSGLLEYRTTRPSWMADNTEGLPQATRTRLSSTEIFSRWDTSAQVGGPIVKDKLFFFAGYQYVYDETQAALTVAPAITKWPRYVGKVNWAIAKHVQAEGTYSYSKSDFRNFAPNFALDAGGLTAQPNHLWSGRVTWALDPRTLWEFRTGGLDYVQDVQPQPPNSKEGPPPRRDAVTGISSVNFSQFRLQEGSRLHFGTSLTRHVENLAGGHALKVGAEIERLGFTTTSGFPGGLSYTDRNGVPDQVVAWAGDIEKGTGTRTTFYAMDDWKVSSKVTLQPGLRYTRYNASTPSTPDVYETSALSPRFGFAWDVFSDHRTVVRGQAGRFHAAMTTSTWDFMDARRSVRITSRILAGGALQEINRVTPAGNTGIDPDLEQSYMDQYFVGAERQMFEDFSVKVQYIHRDYRNTAAFIDTRSVYSPIELRDPGRDNVLGNADDGDLLTVYALQNPGQSFLLFTNPDGADRRYDAFQVIAQKRFADNWQLLASYTRSSSRGRIDNTNANATLGEGGSFANPNAAINADGRSGLDFPHMVGIRGTYHSNLLGGFNLGASYTYASGVAWSRLATFRLPQGNANIRVAPRGTEEAAAMNQLDARFEKLIPLGSRSRNLGLYVDVFNILNKGFPPQTRYEERSGASFGQPLNWVEGRAARVAARLTF